MIFTVPCPRGANLRNPYLHGSTTSGLKGYRTHAVLPSSRYITFPPLRLPLDQLKSLIPPKIAHSSITSHRTFFITLALGMRVLDIAKNVNQYLCSYHKTIQFCVRPIPINSNTSHLTNSYITTLHDMWGWTGALNLTHLTVNVNR